MLYQKKIVTNLFPKSIAIHVFVIITEWSICKWAALHIHIIQFPHVCPHNLISINKNNLKREHHKKSLAPA
jgi:hypothetical protein